ncbi:hypothetical protein DPSP01_007197 [Paraphaeosphaeria sporulosa]|uniref:Uncharacterized protein n=1 Tax=Paraphaeosphaeria sporulosa TaxID=1460663 RepID=A0A177CPD4_9PLEO|nr:uncharacterized protein CC84DRAFT_1174249 [Paraphaeosphaeria sporulosa]OAG08832.1 hypothetical protein CC84DRAFT_1174249 [Paraphaeosphaeria sporulosa]
MMIQFIVSAFALLLFPLASSWPLDVVSTTEALAKRLDKPPVPGASDLRPHLEDVPSSSCMFYTGGTLAAAQQYADNNELFILADLDKDGWAATSQEDEDGQPDYNVQCPMSWAFQEQYAMAGVGWGETERNEYFDNLSEAFAQKCNGDIVLALPPSRQIPEDSVFARVEWPVLQFNPTVNTIRSVVLNTGDDADGTPLSPLEVFWQRCGAA